jgi:transposase-like protein
MARRKRRKFTPQFKADAVRLVTTGAKTIAAVTEEFDRAGTACARG